MGKQKKIGRDIISKGASGIISAKEHEKYEQFLEERRKQKEADIEGKEIKTRMPEEREPSADEEEKERAKEYAEMLKLRKVRVRKHQRGYPRKSKIKTDEEEEKDV